MNQSGRAIVLGLGLGVLLGGCGGGAPPPTPPAPGPIATPPPRAAVMPKEPDAGPPLAPSTYDAKQRRDPFAPLAVVEGAKGLTVASAKLVGLIQGRQGTLGLVEAPDGIGYILKPGDVLGDGRVTEVGQGSISFSVAARPGQPASTVTLRLRTD
jgi:hypothetical protein